MNTGVADAYNLAWKLARVILGVSSPALMRSYEAERRPVAVRNAEHSTHNFKKMDDVARTLGLNPAAVEKVFGGKEALWKAAVEHAFRPLVEAYATGLGDLRDVTPLQALQVMMRRFILFSGRHPHVGMFVSRESMIGRPRLR